MITYVKDSNAAAYTYLFERASKKIREVQPDGIEFTGDNAFEDINSLEEYFSYIKELSKIDRKYTILPLDEDVFEINANTRAITIPSSFKNNGISVQGDEVAEILYFKIDRFFDATDLNEKEIYIQWENANGDSGLSKEWVRDLESEPGYIIFGWPLSSAITEKDGTVKFSVRFYSLDDSGKITYSFSTLTASATIKTGLNLDLGNTYIDDVSQMIEDRFTDSSVIGGLIASAPVYILDLLEKVNLDESGEKVLKVEAYSPDAGTISYSWKMVKNGETIVKNGETIFEVVEDTERVANRIYYVTSDGGSSYTVYGGEDISGVTVYARFATLTVDETGEYFAVTTNRAGRTSTTTADSTHCIVPGPSICEITTQPAAYGILTEENDYTVTLTFAANKDGDGTFSYQWYKNGVAIDDATEDTYEATEDGLYNVAIINTLNKDTLSTESDISRITHSASEPNITYPLTTVNTAPGKEIRVEANADNDAERDASDTITYQWYNWNGSLAGSDLETDTVAALAGTYQITKYDVAIEGATQSTYEIPKDENDAYFCLITNTYNNTTTSVISPFFVAVG